MDAERQIWFDKYKKYFQSTDLDNIKMTLENTDAYTFALIRTTDYKNPKMSTVLALFLGWFGIDSFYEGNCVKGIIKLFTLGGFYIWNIIDIFTAKSRVTRQNAAIWNAALKIGEKEASAGSGIDMEKIKNTVKSREFRDTAQKFRKAWKELDAGSQAFIGR